MQYIIVVPAVLVASVAAYRAYRVTRIPPLSSSFLGSKKLAFIDSFEVSTNIPQSREDPIVVLTHAFFSTWIFGIERFILRLLLGINITDELINNANFLVGEKVGPWEVVERSNNEIMLKWSVSSWNLSGVTWLSSFYFVTLPTKP
jgi:hypothetical protein